MKTVFSHVTLQALYESARTILDCGASAEILRGPIEELEKMVGFRNSALGQSVIAAAQRNYDPNDGLDVAIDRETIMYHNDDDGHWVLGWCFVSDEEVSADGEGQGDLSPHVVVAAE